MPDVFDPWQLSSGLVDDCNVQVKDAYFAFDPQYNNGETLVLMWEVTTDDQDTPETTLMFSTGSGWDTKDKGQTAIREDGKQKGFSKQSGIGLLVSSAIEVGAGDVLKSRGTPMQAAIWNGLSFHMKRRSVSFGGDIGDKDRLLPTEFLGDGGSGTAMAGGQMSGQGQAQVAAAQAVANAGATTNGAGVLTPAVKVKLLKLAKECTDHDNFVERAFSEIDEVNGDAAAEAAVIDPDVIFAKAHSTP